jgi:glucokinase
MAHIFKLRTGKIATPLEVESAAKAGDKDAIQVFSEMTHGLAAGLANIMQVINPDVIVIGGGLRRVKMLWQPAIKEAKKRVIYPELRTTIIVKSELGSNAGVLGASLLTRD